MEHLEGDRQFRVYITDHDYAWIDYEVHEGVYVLLHVEVPPALRGKGAAAVAAKRVMDHLQAERLPYGATCTYLRDKFLVENPEYAQHELYRLGAGAEDAKSCVLYERRGRVAYLSLNRPHRGNGITQDLTRELEAAVERANLDPSVHVIGLSGQGKGFCGGYDLVESAQGSFEEFSQESNPESPTSARTIKDNHDPARVWDPVVDYAMMSRNVRGFMSLFRSDKPVVCKVHGFCVAGGTDMALCSDLLVMEDQARIGYSPARVWGVPTTAMWVDRVGTQRAKRLLFTGDLITGEQAVEWGLALECAPRQELDARFERLLRRVALLPVNQLVMHKLVCNRPLLDGGLESHQLLSVLLDGVARHTPEGYAWAKLAKDQGFKQAVHQRDEPFRENELGLQAKL